MQDDKSAAITTYTMQFAAGHVQNVGLPEPIQNLSQSGQISPEEENLAKTFYHDVYQAGVLPQIGPDGQAAPGQGGQGAENAGFVRGVFALLDSVDEQLLAAICALLLELKLVGEDHPMRLEEVGRRVMGYQSAEANSAAGAALLRAALWVVRFGYQNPQLCTNLYQEKQQNMFAIAQQ